MEFGGHGSGVSWRDLFCFLLTQIGDFDTLVASLGISFFLSAVQ